MAHLTYLMLLAGCLLGTAPLELWLGTRVYRRWRRLLVAVGPTALVFGAWDVYAIGRKAWSYNARYISGWKLPGHLPLEELLFFLVIPTCSVLTMEAVRRCRPQWCIGDEVADQADDGAAEATR